MMEDSNKIPSAADLLKENVKKAKNALQKTRGISADMVADAEAMFRSNPTNPVKLSSTNHKKKTQKLPPSNFIG
ncbi:MAG: hypothetical protein JSW64_11090 [Candidatus Zixiibacteriota bacterium]|nr:MAG: hypothetical protein JSW64_11090 [candidate division Zixibacteria bacterium]